MTVNRLIKELEKIQEKYGKRATVVIDMAELKCNQTIMEEYSHWSISGAKYERILWSKDDSFVLADGSERTRAVVSLSC